MKNLISLFVFCFAIAASAQVINFPDANFKQKLILLGVDLNSDNEIQVSEAMQRTHLDLISYSITNISGLEYFVNLETLILQDIPISTIAPIYESVANAQQEIFTLSEPVVQEKSIEERAAEFGMTVDDFLAAQKVCSLENPGECEMCGS